jgi:CubicO group peptidase (beta-lactamase class C family)
MNETNMIDKTGALDALFQPHNRSDAPGLVVGVAQHGRRLYRRGFGLASVELGVANTAWTRMRIGSTSKHFTCLAALLLAEEGKLDVDASAREYFPALSPLRGEPTLRQFMTHTSGYRCFLDLASLGDGMAIKPRGEALSAQLRQTAVNFAPGEKILYCNGGYHLLSLVIEKVAGMPFEQFLKERIFTPLGMVDTISVPSDFEIHRGMATLHVPRPPEQGGGWRLGIFPTEELRGEGAMISSLDDMLTWLAHLRSPHKTVGSEASWRQMTTPVTLNNGLVAPYGLGLMLHDYRGLQVIHHAGGVVGGTCQMITVPSHALDIIIMTNGAQANPMDLGYSIIDTVLGDALPGAVKEKTAAARFQPMLGTRYHAGASGLVCGFVEAPEGKLGLTFLDGMPVPMAEQDTVLRIGFEEMALGPLEVPAASLAAEGQEAPPVLTLSEGGQPERYERLPATPPAVAVAGKALLGRYHAPDLGADALMRFEGAQLLLDVFGAHGRDVMVLEPFSDLVFGLRFGGEYPPLRGVLSAERSDGAVNAFRINTHRTRNLRFERLAD